MDRSHDEDYYDIVHLFPTGEGRFDISNIKDNPIYLTRCNLISPRNIVDEFAFITHCTKVATYINDFYSKWPIEYETDRCKYLNYSINDVVKNYGNHNYNEEHLIQAYNRLATELSECKNSIKSIEKSVFMNVKELSNIYYRFNKYINAVKANQDTDCEDVYDSVKLYLSNENSCKGLKNKFCDAVDNFKNYYHQNISLVKCKNAEYILKPFLSLDHAETRNFGEEAEEAAVEGDVRRQEIAMFIPIQEDSSEMGQSKSTITTASSIILFTPLGTWLRTLVQRKSKKTISMYDEALRFNNNSSIQSKDSGNTEFNLQYHSSRTS
ncbi:unnamed protein product [Plasmodium vivax]|uniref:(malaria parasite P. vivax) hypothetical protein n=1 Tax=Plasmodium vivax TaxID=5855 RepID=A0A8S4HET8_PLAVI|nr:unnamed protein product [Plasmodium vivax]